MRGTVHPDFEPVRHALSLCVPKGRPGGAAVTVYHHGEKVVELAAGTADEAGRPFEVDSLAVSMSTTKGVAATLLHRLISLGMARLDDRVVRYWPEFGQAGKAEITLRQALAHQAGLHEVQPLVTDFEQLYEWDRMIHAIERAEPRFEPGTDFGYHAFTYGWLVGEIARRVAGEATFQSTLDRHLAKPLGVKGLFVGVPDAEMHRVADVVGIRRLPLLPAKAKSALASMLDTASDLIPLNTEFDESLRSLFPPGIERLDLNSRAFRAACMPAVNGHFDATSLARMYAALANDGHLDGLDLLSPEVVAEARRDHNGFFTACRVIPFPLRIKLGYHRAISLGLRVPALGRTFDLGVASPNSFGHFGFGGSGAWADPERRLAVGLVTNTFFGRLPMDLRTVGIATAAALAADRRRDAGRAGRDRGRYTVAGPF